MNNSLRAAALVIVSAASAAAQPPVTVHYKMQVRLEPDSHHITAVGRIDGRTCDSRNHLYLNRSFALRSFRVAGRKTPVSFDTAAAPAQWTEVTRPLTFACRAGALEFAYDGVIRDTVSGVNMITPELIELALYSGWFPFDPSVTRFTYDLELNLPQGWVVRGAGPGKVVRRSSGRQVIDIRSAQPGMDIAIVAAPRLIVRHAGTSAATVEVVAAARDSAYASDGIENLRRALALYETWYGSASQPVAAAVADQTPPTSLVYSPRSGWAYSRLPLLVIPISVVRELSLTPVGRARIFQGTAHELGHFWWRVADTGTLNDWINEGLAEFSAYSAATQLFGNDVRDTIAAAYHRHIARVRGPDAIAATSNDSPDRYVNHYEKPALLFEAIASDVGADRLHEFLRSYYHAHVAAGDATTTNFLDAARVALGDSAATRIRRCVTEAWTAACGL